MEPQSSVLSLRGVALTARQRARDDTVDFDLALFDVFEIAFDFDLLADVLGKILVIVEPIEHASGEAGGTDRIWCIAARRLSSHQHEIAAAPDEQRRIGRSQIHLSHAAADSNVVLIDRDRWLLSAEGGHKRSSHRE